MLFMARCLDRFTKAGGTCSLLTPLTTYKTAAGAGYRRFLAEGKTIDANNIVKCKVVKIHDLVELYPFEDATNRASMIVTKKEGKTTFPIKCTLWRNKPGCKVLETSELDDLDELADNYDMVMTPITRSKPSTPWMTITTEAEQGLRKIIGRSSYDAHEGVNTSMNGVYWVKIVSVQPNGIMVSNQASIGKIALTSGWA